MLWKSTQKMKVLKLQIKKKFLQQVSVINIVRYWNFKKKNQNF